jgi:hypothetical protein
MRVLFRFQTAANMLPLLVTFQFEEESEPPRKRSRNQKSIFWYQTDSLTPLEEDAFCDGVLLRIQTKSGDCSLSTSYLPVVG